MTKPRNRLESCQAASYSSIYPCRCSGEEVAPDYVCVECSTARTSVPLESPRRRGVRNEGVCFCVSTVIFNLCLMICHLLRGNPSMTFGIHVYILAKEVFWLLHIRIKINRKLAKVERGGILFAMFCYNGRTRLLAQLLSRWPSLRARWKPLYWAWPSTPSMHKF